MTAATPMECVSGGASSLQQPAPQDVVFPLGAVVQCRTMRNESISGEVLCYDHATRLLVLRLTNGVKPEMRFVNLALVEAVAVVKNPPADHSVSFPYSTAVQGQERLKRAEKKKVWSMPSVDVTPTGQRVFIAIRKTLEEIRWDKERIIVLNRVSIRPPYTSEEVEPILDQDQHANTQAHNTAIHVKKILDKYHFRHSASSTISGDRTADNGASSTADGSSDRTSDADSSGERNGPLSTD